MSTKYSNFEGICWPKIPEMKKNFNVEKISVMKPDLINDITGKSSFSQSLEAGETGSRFLVLEGKPRCAHCQHVFSDLKKDTRRNLTHPRNYSPGAREAAVLSRETKTPLTSCSCCLLNLLWEDLERAVHRRLGELPLYKRREASKQDGHGSLFYTSQTPRRRKASHPLFSSPKHSMKADNFVCKPLRFFTFMIL